MLGIYVHTPFCVHRCSYCDFYSSTRYDSHAFASMSAKLAWEAEQAARWLADRHLLAPVQSVFFGGGTPSLFPVEELARVFASLKAHYAWAPDAEITLEANPETVVEGWAPQLLAQTPVNRVSLGAQSFQARYLEILERRGSAESIRSAVCRLRAAGVKRLSLDLIFGIPGQTAPDVLADIDAALELEPGHLSFYSLTLKPGHKLFAALPSDDRAADLYEVGAERLAQSGYRAYEISNFSLPGHQSRHNSLYWGGGDFLGLGPSAASRFFWAGTFHHRKQVSSWEAYLKVDSFPSPEFEANSVEQTVLESVFLELRQAKGIALDTFRQRYGQDLRKSPQLRPLTEEGLVELAGTDLRLTPKGWLLAEGIAQKLLQ